MLKGRLYIVSILTALLWVASVNHCALESLFSPDKTAQSVCTSHSEGDPGSHNEGQPCAVKVVAAKPQIETSQANIAVSLLSTISFLVNSPEPRHFESLIDTSTDVRRGILDPLLSLSIASNAPPYRSI